MYLYLASPYSSSDADEMQRRFEAAEAATANLLRRDFAVYSPIVHCHALARRYDLPTDFKFWETYNFRMLSTARILGILRLPGWETSNGVAGELNYARVHHIPVFYLIPESMDLGFDNEALQDLFRR